jgi:transcriptional regulator with XRE-family HTH domain
MTPDQFRAALCRLGQTQAGAARLLGVDGRTVRRYASGEREIPKPAQRLLWACERYQDLAAQLAELQPADGVLGRSLESTQSS